MLFIFFVSANEVSVSDLVLLNDEDLKELVPLIGPRKKIMDKISKLKSSQDKGAAFIITIKSFISYFMACHGKCLFVLFGRTY